MKSPSGALCQAFGVGADLVELKRVEAVTAVPLSSAVESTSAGIRPATITSTVNGGRLVSWKTRNASHEYSATEIMR